MDEYVIQELVLGLNSIYSNILVRIILYGSVAKNTSTAESDIDLSEFTKRENTLPFFINVKKEGVVLWTAA